MSKTKTLTLSQSLALFTADAIAADPNATEAQIVAAFSAPDVAEILQMQRDLPPGNFLLHSDGTVARTALVDVPGAYSGDTHWHHVKGYRPAICALCWYDRAGRRCPPFAGVLGYTVSDPPCYGTARGCYGVLPATYAEVRAYIAARHPNVGPLSEAAYRGMMARRDSAPCGQRTPRGADKLWFKTEAEAQDHVAWGRFLGRNQAVYQCPSGPDWRAHYHVTTVADVPTPAAAQQIAAA